MSLGAAVINHSHKKIGTCPHGLPMGACPICNGMAGGNSTTKRDTPRNVGEMTYNQCAAIGAMLKAQKLARHQAQQAQQNHLQVIANLQKELSIAHQKVLNLASLIEQKMPPIIAKPINFVLTGVIAKTLSIIQNLPNNIANLAQVITQKFTDISDKLAAIYGEIKASIEEKISKFKNSMKKKLKSLFFVFGSQETDDEDKKIDETKKAFELKTFIHKLYKKLKGKDEKEIEENERNTVT